MNWTLFCTWVAATVATLPPAALSATDATVGMTRGPTPAHDPSGRPGSPPPEWLLEEMRRLVTSGQAWITDNAQYMSDDEQWEQYGMQWQWEPDSTAIVGRLFGLIDGEDRATFWEMRMYWDEGRQVARLWQKHRRTGVVGDGTTRRTGNGIETEAVQTFTGQDGVDRRVRHLATTTEDTHDTRSFDWVDGQWQVRRHYVWRKLPFPTPHG